MEELPPEERELVRDPWKGQHNLWLFFDLAREGEVRFITLTRTPPVPRD